MDRSFISLTSDFGVQSQGVGIMEATARMIAPAAVVIHLMHGLPAFDILAAARTLETTRYLPVGKHVCVCDPGVGTARRGLVCEVARGDYLIGPDNGVLLPAIRVLGGISRVHQLTNHQYMRTPVSPLFHGRDVFVPAAAHLCNGVGPDALGPAVEPSSLVTAPYEDAARTEHGFAATVIQINKFGSLHLNILHEQWDACEPQIGRNVTLDLPDGTRLSVPIGLTFGDVSPGSVVVLRDDYGRVEVAQNLGSLVDTYPLSIGDEIAVTFD